MSTPTVAPASAVPLRVVPSALIAPVGAAGAVVSGAVPVPATLVTGEVLPAASVALTPTLAPLYTGGFSVTL